MYVYSEVTTGTEWAANEAVPWDIDLHKSSQEWRVVSTSEHAPWQPHNQQNESNNWVDDEQWQGAPSWGHGEASSLVSIMDSVSQVKIIYWVFLNSHMILYIQKFIVINEL